MEDTVCSCSGTTRTQILAILARGAETLEEISYASGACSGCGSCDYDVLDIIREYQRSFANTGASTPEPSR